MTEVAIRHWAGGDEAVHAVVRDADNERLAFLNLQMRGSGLTGAEARSRATLSTRPDRSQAADRRTWIDPEWNSRLRRIHLSHLLQTLQRLRPQTCRLNGPGTRPRTQLEVQ
jgi:hypothetical protein